MMNRLISFFARPHELGELGLDPDRPRPPPPAEQGEPEYFQQLLKYLRERSSQEQADAPASQKIGRR
jgi:hypothetical protein